MTLITVLLLAPFILLTSCFALELYVGLRPIVWRPLPVQGAISAVIVVPAHNEEAIIGDSLSALRAVAQEVRILVVADNCTDRTAAIARELGIELIERKDEQRRGKGFALDFARTYLRQSKPDVVLVLDADCTTDADSIKRLIAGCTATGRPCQAVNLQRPHTDGSPAVQLSTFAVFIKNVIRQRALKRLAGHVHLLGTGMAFPWLIFNRAGLATDNIAEDLQIGVELAEAGNGALFIEEASVWSDPEAEENTLAQRHRWEGGFLENALGAAPKVFRRSFRSGDLQGVWAAINLSIPPLALLILLDLAALLLGSALSVFAGADEWPVITLSMSLLLACIGLALAWTAGGCRFVTLGGLVRIPLYVLWKLPMYIGFARRGTPKHWIRTR